MFVQAIPERPARYFLLRSRTRAAAERAAFVADLVRARKLAA